MAGWSLWAAGAAGLLVALVLLLLLVPVRIELEYHRHPGSWGTGSVLLCLLGGLVRVRRTVSGLNQVDALLQRVTATAGRPGGARSRRGLLLRLAHAAVDPVLASLDVEEASLTLELGTGDAARTALATGTLWGILGSAYTFALTRLRHRPRQPRLVVRPNFNSQTWCLSLDLLCIIKARPGHIIGALLAAAGKLAIKGGMRRGRPSDSGTYEDSHGEHQRHG
ncbi:MAG: DUF2953 domain-containing protein [Symbiobacteriia bacterium]